MQKKRFVPYYSVILVNVFLTVTLIFLGMGLLSGKDAYSAEQTLSKTKPNLNFQELIDTLSPGEWRELPGTISEVFVDKQKTQGEGEVIGARAVIIAWNGAAWDDKCGYFFGGGHRDYGGNEVYSYCWEGKRPFSWEVLMPPSKTNPDDHSTCPHPLEGPRAYHTYNGVMYVPDTKSIFVWGVTGYCQKAMFGRDELPELMLDPNPRWKLNPQGPVSGMAHTAYNDRNGQVYIWAKGRVFIFDPKTLNYKTSRKSTASYGANANMTYDSQRDVLWIITKVGLFQFVLDSTGDVSELKQIAAASQLPSGISGTDGMALRKGKLFFWAGNNTVIKFDPDDGSWATYVAEKGPTRATSNGIFSKWHYLEKYDVFVGVSHFKQGMWVWKPSEDKGQEDTRKISLCNSEGTNCADHKLMAAVLKALKPGSLLKVSAGLYADDAIITEKNITIIGEAGASISGIAGRKATFVAAGDDLTFSDLEISLPIGSAASNEGCFRGEGNNLTLKNIYCHDIQIGIIGGPGTLIIEGSRFENSGLNGHADLGHMVYACSNGKCPEGSLIIRDSKFTRMGINRPGHGIKSRAPKNLIENVVIEGLDSRSARAIDISQGGDTIIRNVVMQKGKNSDNDDFIGIALEGKKHKIYENTKTHIENVIAICDLPTPCDFIRYKGSAPTLKNIVLIGNFKFYDDLYPISKDEIKIYRSRSEAGLKEYPEIPEHWMQINPPN